MINPNDPAYPCDVPRIGEEQGEFFTGMTIRQYFVAKAMEGLCAKGGFGAAPAKTIAALAVDVADAALAEEARTRSKA